MPSVVIRRRVDFKWLGRDTIMLTTRLHQRKFGPFDRAQWIDLVAIKALDPVRYPNAVIPAAPAFVAYFRPSYQGERSSISIYANGMMVQKVYAFGRWAHYVQPVGGHPGLVGGTYVSEKTSEGIIEVSVQEP